LTHLLVHTGQHYDERMSNAFFDGLRSMGSYLHRDIAMGVGGSGVLK
jgi:UDP-N-acetylglucosamine 2-epimerase